jgi:hypothetical protein
MPGYSEGGHFSRAQAVSNLTRREQVAIALLPRFGNPEGPGDYGILSKTVTGILDELDAAEAIEMAAWRERVCKDQETAKAAFEEFFKRHCMAIMQSTEGMNDPYAYQPNEEDMKETWLAAVRWIDGGRK